MLPREPGGRAQGHPHPEVTAIAGSLTARWRGLATSALSTVGPGEGGGGGDRPTGLGLTPPTQPQGPGADGGARTPGTVRHAGAGGDGGLGPRGAGGGAGAPGRGQESGGGGCAEDGAG